MNTATTITGRSRFCHRCGNHEFCGQVVMRYQRHTNGLIRQYLPKGQNMAHLTQQDCNRLAAQLNTRPRKPLPYRTREECYEP